MACTYAYKSVPCNLELFVTIILIYRIVLCLVRVFLVRNGVKHSSVIFLQCNFFEKAALERFYLYSEMLGSILTYTRDLPTFTKIRPKDIKKLSPTDIWREKINHQNVLIFLFENTSFYINIYQCSQGCLGCVGCRCDCRIGTLSIKTSVFVRKREY